MTAAFVVPRRDDRGPRDRLWRFCRDHWLTRMPDVPIVEGHDEGGVFNRSRALNTARLGVPNGTGTLVILDSDSLVDPGQVRSAVDLSVETGQVVVGFGRWVGLNNGMTEKVLAGFRGSWEPGMRNLWEDSHSALVAVPAALWDRVGGFDERFSGWGLEDSAFVLACDIAARQQPAYRPGAPRAHKTFRWPHEPHLRIDGDCWHLWHPRNEQARGAEREANRPLFDRYQRAWNAPAGEDVAMLDRLIGERT